MEKFKFDVISKTLTITAQFAEAMNNPGSEEYKLYQKFSTDFPNLKVIGRPTVPPLPTLPRATRSSTITPTKVSPLKIWSSLLR